MLYNRELAKRFISDYKLPIPLINEEYFFYHLNLYQKDYGSLDKYNQLLDIINKKYDGDCNKFLEDYYNIRDKIITNVIENEAFQKFNTMDMSAFSIKERLNITSNNIYNQNNIDCYII